jgi:undecaprenyl-diphosphatase
LVLRRWLEAEEKREGRKGCAEAQRKTESGLNDYLIAAILGIVEGLTEFLPVSSTAHLRICEALMGIELDSGYWKMFAIVIQLGAILTLPIYFRKRIADFLRTFPGGLRGDRTALTHPVGLTAVAFLVTAIPAWLLTKVIGKNLENMWVMAMALLVGGAVMWIIDLLYDRGIPQRHTEQMDEMSIGQAIWIGIGQLVSAVVPGTSRSMATISAGEMVGMSRAAALEFSFFVSMPTMAAATGYTLLKSLRHPVTEGGSAIGAAPVGTHGWVLLAIGFAISFIVAYAVMAWFMRWVRTRGFVPFAMYRIIVGTCVVAWLIRSGA